MTAVDRPDRHTRPRVDARRLFTVVVASAMAATTTGCGSSSKPAVSASSGYAKELKFSDCVRTHGVPGFPDPKPSANGGGALILQGGPGSQLDPSSPSFQSAQQACARLVPNGGPGPAGGLPAKAKEQGLRFAACMRSHGVPGFPDPVFSGNGSKIQLRASAGVNPAAPAFKAAQKACGSPLPGGILRSSGGVGGPG